uniref:Uncharacterized protein n=1 Tax=Pectinophora gossypiella TaxID=13191 RepID=A0A1E1WJB9_PECGO
MKSRLTRPSNRHRVEDAQHSSKRENRLYPKHCRNMLNQMCVNKLQKLPTNVSRISQDIMKNCLQRKNNGKKEVNSRRNKYHDLRQQYQMALKTPGRSRMSYSALSAEDIEFLKGKANIPKLVESQLKLHKSVKELRALYKRANELDSVIIKHCEEKVDKITEYIFENSTIEPKD